MTTGPRTIYLARRHPFLDHSQFVSRWRAHGILSQQLDGWRGVERYEQSEALQDSADLLELVPGGTQSYDGVGMSWFRDEQALGGFGTEAQQTVLRQDELQTFAEVVANSCFIGRSTVEHGEQRCGVKLVSFLRRPEPSDEAASIELLLRFASAILETPDFSDRVVKYAECRPVALDYPGGDRPGLHEYGAVLEIGFADRTQLAAAISAASFSSSVLPAWRKAAARGAITVAVRERLLYGDAGDAPAAKS